MSSWPQFCSKSSHLEPFLRLKIILKFPQRFFLMRAAQIRLIISLPLASLSSLLLIYFSFWEGKKKLHYKSTYTYNHKFIWIFSSALWQCIYSNILKKLFPKHVLLPVPTKKLFKIKFIWVFFFFFNKQNLFLLSLY